MSEQPAPLICFHCSEPITDKAESMPWATRGGLIRAWFHFQCFLDYVDERVIGDTQLDEAMDEFKKRGNGGI